MQTMVPVGADSVWAEDSAGSGPPLMLLHEHVGDSRMWDPIWLALTQVCRVIRYDVRGFGSSPPATEQFTLLGDLRAVLDHFGVSRAHFAGCSGGGGMALELAVTEPDRALSLILLCPGIAGYDWPEEPELDAEYEALTAAGDEDGLVELYLRTWGQAGPDPFVAELARSAVRAAPSEAFQQEGKPVFDRLGELSVPAVIMVGDKDWPAVIDCSEQAAARIPGCTLIKMLGVDHYPTAREPDLVLTTILSHCTG